MKEITRVGYVFDEVEPSVGSHDGSFITLVSDEYFFFKSSSVQTFVYFWHCRSFVYGL